jgi:ribosomal protein L10
MKGSEGQVSSTLSYILSIHGQRGVTKDQIRGVISDGTLLDFFEAVNAGSLPSREEFRRLLGLAPLNPAT